MHKLITRRPVRALAVAALGLGLIAGTAVGADASMTSKTAGCKPAQKLLPGFVISGTATATPYADRWITRKINVSATKEYGDVGWEWFLYSITVEGYSAVKFGQTDGSGGNRVIRYTNSTPRDIKITWKKDRRLPFTTAYSSCMIYNF